MHTDPQSLTVKSLRFLVSQLGPEDDDKEVAVLMPYYGRTFPVVAFDHMTVDSEFKADDEKAPLVLIAHRRPHA